MYRRQERMRDPVTGFDYPQDWVKKCKSPELLSLAEEGFAVLTASGSVLRRGYTTGTTAAAACKAAILSLNRVITSVPIHLPCGLTADVPVSGLSGRASCKKFAGDYPNDVTAGCEFIATASPLSEGITFIPGIGIGHFSRDTPRFKKGEPAITPVPLACILLSIQEAFDQQGLSGVQVELDIPRGLEIAKKTLNSRIGVKGGISVLGTTGLVEPWDDHLEETIRERVSSTPKPVLTTGRVGLRYARLMFPDHEVVLVGGMIGEALDAAKGEVILFGLPALILHYINPHILVGTGYSTIEEFSGSPAFLPAMLSSLAVFKKECPHIQVVVVNREGAILGKSP
jgi:cobalt-precorrin-5B (C1)-methyltransferase